MDSCYKNELKLQESLESVHSHLGKIHGHCSLKVKSRESGRVWKDPIPRRSKQKNQKQKKKTKKRFRMLNCVMHPKFSGPIFRKTEAVLCLKLHRSDACSRWRQCNCSRGKPTSKSPKLSVKFVMCAIVDIVMIITRKQWSSSFFRPLTCDRNYLNAKYILHMTWSIKFIPLITKVWMW